MTREFPLARKTRTREHIIADYSAIHFERCALDCGYSIERIMHDYGIDLVVYTYGNNGEIENGEFKVQLKATDSPNYLKLSDDLSFEASRSDLETWLDELMPVILVVYDARQDTAYWVHVQAYFKDKGYDPRMAGVTTNIRISTANALNADAVKQFGLWKNEAHHALHGRIE